MQSYDKKETKWTKEDLIKEAKKYSKRSDFQRFSFGAYLRMRKIDKTQKGFRDKVCSHMLYGNLKWTEESISREVKKYKTRNEFRTKAGGAYNAAKKLGIFDKICNHMKKNK